MSRGRERSRCTGIESLAETRAGDQPSVPLVGGDPTSDATAGIAPGPARIPRRPRPLRADESRGESEDSLKQCSQLPVSFRLGARRRTNLLI
jgi:hypothetical protein